MTDEGVTGCSDAWIEAMPKVELHVHHIGATSLSTLAELAARHPDTGVPTDPEALERFYEFTDFAHFLRAYGAELDSVGRSELTPRQSYPPILRTAT